MIATTEPIAGEPAKTCFSYIRFSSLKQRKGNSEDRQLEIAPRVAKEKRWHLDESLSVSDLGLSAFKRANLGPKGKLGAIKVALEEGRIVPGTICIIEALDRLTRTQIDEAYDLFRDLLRGGLELYVDKGGRHYTKDSLRNPTDLIIAIVELNAANEYAMNLSNRVGTAWQAKRDKLASEGKRLTKQVVGWIDAATWKPIPERVAIVKKIFSLYNAGHGMSAIVRKFNGEKIPTWGRGKSWNVSYIHQILHSRAVIGEFQPHVTKSADTGNYYKRIKSGQPIENYYPAIIDRNVFFATQAKLGDSTRGPKTENIGNLFSGVAFCECGAKMYLAKSVKANQTRLYYMCWSKVKGLGCEAPSIRYEPVENLFVSTVAQNAHKLFQKNATGAANVVQSLKGELEDHKRQIENITKFVIDGKATTALVEKQAELEKKVDRIRNEIQIAESKAVSVRKPQIDFDGITLPELTENIIVRRKVRDFALSHVERMVFPTDRKTVQIQFKSGVMAQMVEDTMKK